MKSKYHFPKTKKSLERRLKEALKLIIKSKEELVLKQSFELACELRKFERKFYEDKIGKFKTRSESIRILKPTCHDTLETKVWKNMEKFEKDLELTLSLKKVK